MAGARLDRARACCWARTSRAHLSNNLPFILAGGGWKHGQHLGFDVAKPYPLTNVYLSVLHRLGINRDKFSSSTGTCRGLEMT